MASKMIMKIKDRSSYYYFDQALKDGKRVTIKYSLFTDDVYEAKAIAIKVKSTIDKISTTQESIHQESYTSFEKYIKSIKNSSNIAKSYIDYKEYREIFKRVVSDFYRPISLNNETETTQEIKIEPNTSLKDIAKKFIKTECVKQKSTENTKNKYLLAAREFDKFSRHKNLSKVSYGDAEDYSNYLVEAKNLHIKTANNYLAYTKKLFDYAIKMESIKDNPFKLVSSYKVTKEEMSPKDNFTINELKRILNTDKKDLRNFMLFALHTGLRLGEIWSLDSSSVKIKDGIKYIEVKTLKQKGGAVKYRTIPIHENIEYLSDLKWLEKIKKSRDNYNYFGKRLNKHIHKVVPDANVSFHRLRGNFAMFIKNYALENGISDLTPILLGHSTDLATDIYAKDVSLRAKILSLKGLDILKEIV